MDIGNSVETGFDRFFAWVPNLIGALVILLIGWIVAKVVAALVRRGLRAVKLDDQLMQGRVGSFLHRGMDSPTSVLATVCFWLVMLGTISLAVTALGIDA